MDLIGTQETDGKGAVWFGKERGSRRAYTALFAHEPGYSEPWIILTDLPGNVAKVAWYRLRGGIEHDFRDRKREG